MSTGDPGWRRRQNGESWDSWLVYREERPQAEGCRAPGTIGLTGSGGEVSASSPSEGILTPHWAPRIQKELQR